MTFKIHWVVIGVVAIHFGISEGGRGKRRMVGQIGMRVSFSFSFHHNFAVIGHGKGIVNSVNISNQVNSGSNLIDFNFTLYFLEIPHNHLDIF
jgi:hypothetical protein